MELEKVERVKVEKEKYEGQLSRFLGNAKGLDESLTLFFSQGFSKDSFVTPNFFSLVGRMKTLDGTYVQSLCKNIGDRELTARVRRHCTSEANPNAEYVFDGSMISYNKNVMSRTFYDPNRKLSLADLRGMGDFTCLSFINAFDLPYLTDTRIDRSSFEHFMSGFLDDLMRGKNPESPEILQLNLAKDASGHLGFTITSWVQILYCITLIIKDIFGLAFEVMQERPPEYFPMAEKIKFIERFIAARQKYLKASDELIMRMQRGEVSYDRQVVLEEITESFKDFVRIDFTRITEGNSRDLSEKTPLGKLEFAMSQLDEFVLSAKGNSKKAMTFFREYSLKNNLSNECRELCEMSLRFQSAFDHFLDFVMDKEAAYQLMLTSGIQLLKILYPQEAFPNVPFDPKSLSNTPTPRSRRGTPRDDSPRMVGRGSPREHMRTSAGLLPNSQAAERETARAAQIEMWKRRSTGGGSPSPEPDRRSPAPTHSAVGSVDGKK